MTLFSDSLKQNLDVHTQHMDYHPAKNGACHKATGPNSIFFMHIYATPSTSGDYPLIP